MLSINIWELLLTIVSFFLLLFVLKRLLYEPLIRFMDARQARIDEGMSAEHKAQETVMADKALLEEAKNKCRREARDIMDKARAKSEEDQSQLAKQARESAAQLRLEMKQTLEQAYKDEEELFAANEAELAKLLAGRLLAASPVNPN